MAKRDHEPGKLVPVTLKKLPDGWHADGGNLYLFVRGASRTWVFRFTAPDGKRKNMGLGPLADVSLAQARDTAKQLRAKVKDPVAPADPQQERRQARDAARLKSVKRLTFKQCAEACIEAMRPGWRNPKHASQWVNSLTTYAYPTLGPLAVADVDTALVIKALSPIWTTKNETASRLRGRIESVLDWAKANGLRAGENPARWKGHLDKLLAAPGKVQKVEHHAALDYRDMGAFMKDLRSREGTGARALEFAILTATRSGEVRGATWEEIDAKARTWTIPASRMKAGREHRVPLSDAACRLLEALPKLDGETLIFPSTKPGKPLSDMTLTAVLRRMEHGAITAHGFRSSFRDWAGETTAHPREVIEHALAHQLADKAEAAYQRGDLLDRRRRLMDDWASHCARIGTDADNVVPILVAA